MASWGQCRPKSAFLSIRGTMRIRMLSVTCLVALCLCATVNAQGYLEPSKGKPVQFPTFGVSLTPAEGWVRIFEGGAGHICRWAQMDAKTKNVSVLVVAETVPASGRSFDAYVEELRKNGGGRLEEKKALLDNEPASVVSAEAKTKGLGFRRGIIGHHGDNFYTLSVFAADNADHAAELENFRAGWKWMPLESPTKHLDLLEGPVPIGYGLLTIRVPKAMRPYPADKGTSCLGIHDYTKKKSVFFLNMASLAKPEELSAEVFTTRHAQALAEKLKLDKPPVSADPKCKVDCRMLETLKIDPAAFGAQGGGPAMATRYVLVFPDPKTVVQFTFTMEDKDTEAGVLYGALVEQIVRSIEKPAKKETPTK